MLQTYWQDFYPVYFRILGDIEQHKNAIPDPIEEELQEIEAQTEQQPQEQAWGAGIGLGSDADESRSGLPGLGL